MNRRAKRTTNQRSPLLVAGVLLGLVVAAWSQRAARVRNATLTQVESAQPPLAEVMLDYTRGLRPASIIVDIRSPNGAGSATIDGDNDLAVVPLTGPVGGTYTIQVTASSRVLGRLRTDRRSFYKDNKTTE